MSVWIFNFSSTLVSSWHLFLPAEQEFWKVRVKQPPNHSLLRLGTPDCLSCISLGDGVVFPSSRASFRSLQALVATEEFSFFSILQWTWHFEPETAYCWMTWNLQTQIGRTVIPASISADCVRVPKCLKMGGDNFKMIADNVSRGLLKLDIKLQNIFQFLFGYGSPGW